VFIEQINDDDDDDTDDNDDDNDDDLPNVRSALTRLTMAINSKF